MNRRLLGLGLVGLGLVGLGLAGVQACPIRALTGVPCPGCGMVRAVIALGSGDPAEAWRMHPLVFLVVPIVGVEVVRGIRGPTWRWPDWGPAVAAALLIGVWAARLATGTHPDGIAWDQGLLARVWSGVQG